MRHYKFCLPLILLTMTSFPLFAGWDEVVVDLADGEQMRIEISDTLEISFSDGVLHVGDMDTYFEFPMDDLLAVRHTRRPENITVGVGSLSSDTSGSLPVLSISGDKIILKGFSDETVVTVHTLDGRLLHSESVGEDALIDISSMDSGIYILNAGRLSWKIRK